MTDDEYHIQFEKNWRLEIPPTICPFCKRRMIVDKWSPERVHCRIQTIDVRHDDQIDSHTFEFDRVTSGVTRQTSIKWTHPFVMPKITITSNSIIYDKDMCLSDGKILHPAGKVAHWVAITGVLKQPNMPGFYSMDEVTDIFKSLINRLNKIEIMK